jgi:hypothetical protein
MLNSFANRKILKTGQPATAKIVEMSAFGGGTRPSNIGMVLRLDPEPVPVYDVRGRWMVSGDESLAIGDELNVVTDGRNRNHVVIDWDRTRRVIKYKKSLVGQVMKPGVPVPMTRVRAEIEEADPGHFARRQTPPVPEPVSAQEANGAVSLASEAGNTLIQAQAEEGESLTSALERLASLHTAGALNDGEFAAAKRHALSDS